MNKSVRKKKIMSVRSVNARLPAHTVEQHATPTSTIKNMTIDTLSRTRRWHATTAHHAGRGHHPRRAHARRRHHAGRGHRRPAHKPGRRHTTRSTRSTTRRHHHARRRSAHRPNGTGEAGWRAHRRWHASPGRSSDRCNNASVSTAN